VLAKGISEGTQAAPASGSVAVMNAYDNDFQFALRGCWRSASQNVSCSGSVTNKAAETRGLNFWPYTEAATYLVDNLGNQYRLGLEQISFGADGQHQMLEPGLPVNFSLDANKVAPEATSISVVLICSSNANS
jgi:hypothetical protein